MTKDTDATVGLRFPADTFAKLLPAPFLAAHLKRPGALRPNGRGLNEFRKPTINTGSLTHTDGSAVVRLGDTAVVCGIRGEILLASDVPDLSRHAGEGNGMIESLGLLVPNLELSTGCSPAHLPGNPPSSLAQSLTYRLTSLLYDSDLLDVADLSILHSEQSVDEHAVGESPTEVTKAFWTLYVDVLCLALDGNAFDAAWLAVIAALQDTSLPAASWSEDREMVLCSPLTSEKQKLQVSLAKLPISSTFAVFTTALASKKRDKAENWLLADPDANEEDSCHETITVVSFPKHGARARLRVEKNGGPFISAELVKQCHSAAEQRREEVVRVLRGI